MLPSRKQHKLWNRKQFLYCRRCAPQFRSSLFCSFRFSSFYFQEMFYNPNGGKGWLVSKLKARRSKLRNVAHPSDQNIQVNNDTSENYNPLQDFEMLRTIQVNPQNMKEIKQKLRLTLQYRRNIFNDKTLSLLEKCPYFFHHSPLVFAFFNNVFGNKNHLNG